MGRKKHTGRKILAVVLVLALAGGAVFYFYTADYYRADGSFVLDAAVTYTEAKDFIALEPEAAGSVGYIFYPGGLVDEKAYLPYLQQVAEKGYLCAVVSVPFHLAILGQNAADSVRAAYPHIGVWAVGGHSLGGVVASGYAAKHEPQVEGLVLLAAYPSGDISASRLFVTSITASEDGVLNWDKWTEAKPKLPGDTLYLTVEGGNHGGFGSYGAQKGDGAATVPRQEQQAQAAEATAELLALLAA